MFFPRQIFINNMPRSFIDDTFSILHPLKVKKRLTVGVFELGVLNNIYLVLSEFKRSLSLLAISQLSMLRSSLLLFLNKHLVFLSETRIVVLSAKDRQELLFKLGIIPNLSNKENRLHR